MLQELRESISPPLSRQALADILNRSPGYILKAESLTFPHVPPSLLDFYTTKLDYPRSLLVEEYRHHQKVRRRTWLSYWRGLTGGLEAGLSGSFVNDWRNQFTGDPPTEYAISQGLCIPAAAVYNIAKHHKVATSIKTALGDLEEYCFSGEVYANTHLSIADVEDVLSICDYWRNHD